MRPILTILAATLLASAASVPAAAAVQYDFVATSSLGGAYGSFSFVSANFISSASTSGTVIPFANLTSCSVTFGSGTCGAQTLFNDTSGLGAGGRDAIAFGTSAGTGAYYYFADNALTTLGSYNTTLFGSGQAATLRVSIAGAAAVPEPATWAMLLVGFGAMGATMRRRKSRLALATA